MKHTFVIPAFALAVSLFNCQSLRAYPMSLHEAELVVTGWLRADPDPLGAPIGRTIDRVQTITNDAGDPVYHVVYLVPSGFAIVSGDNLVEPIIAFATDGVYDRSPLDPLAVLVESDVLWRIAAVRGEKGLHMLSADDRTGHARERWTSFLRLGADGDRGIQAAGMGDIDDRRVDPLLKTRWGQTVAYGPGDRPGAALVPCSVACYNFYTPQVVNGEVKWEQTVGSAENYPCGCVATALAQLMRFHEYPAKPHGAGQNTVWVKMDPNVGPLKELTRPFLGSDGRGGPYQWELMIAEPNCSANEEPARRAIGALCHDAGVAVGATYGPEPNGTWATSNYLRQALTGTLGYANAVWAWGWPTDIVSHLPDMVNPNLDAGLPVVLSVGGEAGSHAVVCDGYGYNGTTLYHHLNMGWAGRCDTWYNLPSVDAGSQNAFTALDDCVYNIFKEGSGEIVSGQLTDARGAPLAGVSVIAETQDGRHSLEDKTDGRGIFALVGCKSNTSYVVRVEMQGHRFPTVQVDTRLSADSFAESGNVWGVCIRENHPQGALYVDANASKDPNLFQNGSIENPFDTVQEAIDASVPGDTVILLPGIYEGYGNQDIDFSGKAVTVRSIDPNDPHTVETTVVDCQGAPDHRHGGFTFDSNETASSALAGISITHGYRAFGGAIFCGQRSGPMLQRLRLIGNGAAVGGGALGIRGNPVVADCSFEENHSQHQGGAVDIWGGEVEFVRCVFSRNRAGEQGTGGAVNVAVGNITLTSCLFSEDGAVGGGAICLWGTTEGWFDPRGGLITRTFWARMHAQNCTFARNASGPSDTDVYLWADEEGWSRRLTGGSRDTIMLFSEATGELTNGIVWANSPQGIDPRMDVSYSDVQGGYKGGRNIDSDPLFIDLESGDYQLQSHSPCIDTGNLDYGVPAEGVDLDGHPRVVDGDGNTLVIIDMGAYEFQAM